jgi:hypothetical protein
LRLSGWQPGDLEEQMKIDSRIESLVREALTAVVKRDPKRLQTAIAVFPDEHALTAGYRLAAAIALYILHDQYGRQPTPAEIRAVADKLVELEGWTDIRAEEVVRYLTTLYDGTRVDEVLPLERAFLVSYVLAGDLLSTCRHTTEDWWDYLDRAEAALEASS